MAHPEYTLIRPWNLRPGDHFIVWDTIAVPERTVVFEVTERPWSERCYFSRTKRWIIPRRLVGASDGRAVLFGTRPAVYYSDQRVPRVKRAAR